MTSNVTNKNLPKDTPVEKPKKGATPPQIDSQVPHHRAGNEQPAGREADRIAGDHKPVEKPTVTDNKHADKPQFDKPIVIDHKPNDNTTIPHHHPAKPDERRTSPNGKSTLCLFALFRFLFRSHSFGRYSICSLHWI